MIVKFIHVVPSTLFLLIAECSIVLNHHIFVSPFTRVIIGMAVWGSFSFCESHFLPSLWYCPFLLLEGFFGLSRVASHLGFLNFQFRIRFLWVWRLFVLLYSFCTFNFYHLHFCSLSFGFMVLSCFILIYCFFFKCYMRVDINVVYLNVFLTVCHYFSMNIIIYVHYFSSE